MFITTRVSCLEIRKSEFYIVYTIYSHRCHLIHEESRRGETHICISPGILKSTLAYNDKLDIVFLISVIHGGSDLEIVSSLSIGDREFSV
jgi:hypothetical protein